MKYKMSTWKLSVEGEFDDDEKAIKSLADSYMKCSKCDLPGGHPIELLTGKQSRTLGDIAKRVYFYVWERNEYGYMAWNLKHTLNVSPWKKAHWWPQEGTEIPKWRKFTYKIVPPQETDYA